MARKLQRDGGGVVWEERERARDQAPGCGHAEGIEQAVSLAPPGCSFFGRGPFVACIE